MQGHDMQIEGFWYPANRGLRVAAKVVTTQDGKLQCVGPDEVVEVTADELDISPRVANTTRWIRLPGGARFETSDNDAVDRFLAEQGRDGFSRFIHRIESAWTYTAVAICVIVATVWAMTSYVIPTAAPKFAVLIPAAAEIELGSRVADLLDASMPRVTDEPARMQALRDQFSVMVAATGSEYPYTLTLRAHEMPNAFALPGGAVSITTGLLEMASDDQVIGVLAHEIGHVEERHGLKSVMRQAGTYALFSTLFGDVTGSTILIYAPALLTELKYSRDTESSADAFAVDLLVDLGRDPEDLVAFFESLSDFDRKDGGESDGSDADTDITDYLSTHPGHAERIDAIRVRSRVRINSRIQGPRD